MPNNVNETENNYAKYFYFPEDVNGNYLLSTDNEKPMLALYPAYRGEGINGYDFSKKGDDVTAIELPEKLEIPDAIGGISVEALVPGIFAGNHRIKEITLPTTVTTIPKAFCSGAINLRVIHGTEHIAKIGAMAFAYTRIKEALFPNLETLDVTELNNNQTGKLEDVSGAFAHCAYLETVNIGKVNTIPMRAFYRCACLREVIGGEHVTSIEADAFQHTRSLRYLPLLNHIPTVADYAFFYSRIVPSLPTNHWKNKMAFPTGDNDTDFWTDIKSTPCINKIRTKLSQTNSVWEKTAYRLDDPSKTYGNAGCPIFSAMHIHSAISGKYYSHPDEFIEELKQKGLSRFLLDAHWPGHFENVAPMFQALGYHTEVIGTDTNLSKDDYQTLVDALAAGAYIFTQVGRYDDYTHGYYNRGHAVVLYGINELGEVCVLDSNVLHETFRTGGFEPGIDVYTYTMPYQNMVGPGSDFVIVYPNKKEPVVQWTGYDAPNVHKSASLPSEYPENQVTISRVTGDDRLPGSGQGILTAYRVGTKAYRTFVPHDKAALYLQMQDPKMNDSWLGWKVFNQKDFARVENNCILSGTLPSQLPTGVNVSVVSSVDPDLPEGVTGHLTTYHLFSSAAYAREEWKPDGSANLYVRHATSHDQWGNWYVFTPTAGANSESQ